MGKDYAIMIDLDGVISDSNALWANLTSEFKGDLSFLDECNYYEAIKELEIRFKARNLLDKFNKTCIDYYENEARLCDGVMDFLARFKEFKLCIFTASPFAKVLLDRFNLTQFFSFIWYEDEFLKSSEQGFKDCMTKLGAKNYIIIDDSPRVISKANELGIFSIGINTKNARLNYKNIGEINEKDIKHSWK